MTDGRIGIGWRVTFTSPDHKWLAKHMGEVVDLFGATTFWKELQILGAPRKPGRPFRELAEVKQALEIGSTIALARGGPDATVSATRPPARMTIEPMEKTFALTLAIRDESLERLGGKALQEIAGALASLIVEWRGHLSLQTAWATPSSPEPFHYPRQRPVRVTQPMRSLGAIVDVLDAQSEDPTSGGIAGRALAIAEIPSIATRVEDRGIVTISWCDDPRDRPSVVAGASAHEAWLLGILPSKLDSAWTDDGDERLSGNYYPPEQPFALVWKQDRQDGFRYVAMVSLDSATPDAETWRHALESARSRRLKDGTALDEVNLLLPSRGDAEQLRDRGKRAGFNRVLYRGEDGLVFDPDPPGLWK